MNLSFPLYHGTSTYFLEYIKKFGLGGRNLIKELMALDFLKELEKLCDIKLITIEDWEYGLKYPVSLITEQKVVFGGSYQHGSVYLTPALSTAVRYSMNKYGSELLTIIFATLKLLRVNFIELPLELEIKYRDIIELELKDFKPLVIEIKDLPISYLSSDEKGNCFEKQLIKIETIIKEKGLNQYQRLTQTLNFRSDHIIPWDLLRIKNTF